MILFEIWKITGKMLKKILGVQYLVQPTSNTCQSTCLKMFAMYLAKKRGMTNPGAEKDIFQIWKEINSDEKHPSEMRNSYENMKWWLEKYFHPMKFHVLQVVHVDEAIRKVRRHIDRGYPVLVSTNHVRTFGHIILVVGYLDSLDGNPSDIQFICHDPYGKFDPQLSSRQYGKRRYDGGLSLWGGGQEGPGKSVVYDYDGIRRIRADRHSAGTFFLISAMC